MRLLVIGRQTKANRDLVQQLSLQGISLAGFDKMISDIHPSSAKSFDALLVDVTTTARTTAAAAKAILKQGVRQPTMLVGNESASTTEFEALGQQFDHTLRSRAYDTIVEWLGNLREDQCSSVPLQPLICGDLSIDLNAHDVRLNGKRLELTSKELSVLATLAESVNRPVQKDAVMRALYSDERQPSKNVIEVYISSLRKKLGMAGSRVETTPCGEYRLVDDALFAS